MPIQFRCKACQQLLGIARRKAGKIVDCPTCGSKTLVPPENAPELHEPPPLPPVRRQPSSQPVSIFDRVDVEKLLQPPRQPELVEEHGSSTALAEPPPRVSLSVPDLFPEDVTEEAKDEPQVVLAQEDTEPKAPLPDDQPFAVLAQVPTLTPVRKSASNVQIAVYALAAAALMVGAFFAGHWVGAHRPLF